MSGGPEIFVRCIEPATVAPASMGPVWKVEGLGPWQLYMVLGMARGVEGHSGRTHLVGEFEAFVLGQPGRVRSRECWLPNDVVGQVLIEHVRRCPYDVALIYMTLTSQLAIATATHPDQGFVYPVIRLLQTTDTP